jgi:PKD repeat protein
VKNITILLLLGILFSVKTNAQPIHVSPSNGTTGITASNVVVRWYAEPGASFYNCQVASNSSFINAITSSNITGTSCDLQNLQPGVTYYWRVRAYFPSTGYTNYSSGWSFSILGAPTASFDAGNSNICQNNTVAFYSTSSGATSYSWSFPGGNPSSSTQANPIVFYNTPGSYSVILTVSNSTGSDSEVKSGYVTVRSGPTTASISVSRSTTKCLKDTVVLSASPAGYPFSWSSGDTSRTISKTAFGSYTYTITDAGTGCSSSASVTLIQDSLNQSIITAARNVICYNDSLELSTIGTFSKLLWSTGDTTRSIFTKKTGIHSVVAVIDSFECPIKSSITLTKAYPTFKIVKTNLPSTICFNDSGSLSVQNGFSQYLWNTGSTDSIINVASAGTYWVTATDSVGCKTYDSLKVNLSVVKCYSGNYTVGGLNPDFVNIKAAYDSLDKHRVSGPVNIMIRPGTYTERLRFTNGIQRTVSNTLITFRAENGITGSVIIKCVDTISLEINSTSLFEFRNLVFDNRGTVEVSNIRIFNSQRIGFYDNIFYTKPKQSPGIDGLNLYLSGANNIILSGNKFIGSGLRGYSSSRIHVLNNFIDTIMGDIDLSLSTTGDTTIIENNQMNSLKVSGSTTYTQTVFIKKNKVNSVNIEYLKTAFIVNNNISGGLYQYKTNLYAYNNNFYLNSEEIALKPLDIHHSIYFANNNIYKAALNGKIISIDTTGSGTISIMELNHNNYFFDTTSTQKLFYIKSASYSFSQWKTAIKREKNSVIINPMFRSSGDLTTGTGALNAKGAYHSMVTDDINGTPRRDSAHDIGSYEYNEVRDLALKNIQFRSTSCIGSNSEPVTMTIENVSPFYSFATTDSLKFELIINSDTVVKTGKAPKTLLFRDSASITFPAIANLSSEGDYTISARIYYEGDSNMVNDFTGFGFNLNPKPTTSYTVKNVCVNTPVLLTDSSTGNGLTYKWTFSDGATFSSKTVNKIFTTAGSKSVKLVTKNTYGCADSLSKLFDIFALPSPVITQNNKTLVSSPGKTYQWTKNFALLPNQNSQTYTPTESGNYRVILTNDNDCESTSQPFNFTFTGLNSIDDNTLKIHIFPNPVNSRLTISSDENKISEVFIYNTLGELVQYLKEHNYAVEISTQSWASGMYYINCITEQGDIVQKKIIKQ